MMKRDLLHRFDEHLAGNPSDEPWMDALSGGLIDLADAPADGWAPELVAQAAAMAQSSPVVAGAARPAGRARARRLRRTLVMNAVVVGLLLFASAAFAVTTTRSGSAPAPVRAVVDRVAEWVGYGRVSPVEIDVNEVVVPEPEDEVDGGHIIPDDEDEEADADLPGNRGEGTGPPDNSNAGGNGNGNGNGPPDDAPGNRGEGTGPPDNSNAGGNGNGPPEDVPGNRGEGTGPPDNSNAGGNDTPPGQADDGADAPGNRGEDTGPPDNSNAGGNGDEAKGNGRSVDPDTP